MSPGNCVTAAERQIRDLGGEAARDYDPHGAISTPSHLNRSFLHIRQADSLFLGVTGFNWTKTGHLIFCMIFETSPAAISHRHSPFVRPTAPSFVGSYQKPYSGLSKPSMNGLPCVYNLRGTQEISSRPRTTGKRLFFHPFICNSFLGWSSCFTFGLPCKAQPRLIVPNSPRSSLHPNP